MATVIRTSLLCHRNDARINAALRSRPARDHLSRFTSPSRCADCRGYRHKQNGSRVETSIRPNAGSEMGDQYGILRERRRLLSLFIQRRSRCRSSFTCRHLRPWLPSYRGGFVVWCVPATEEDETDKEDSYVVSEVRWTLMRDSSAQWKSEVKGKTQLLR